LEQLLREHEVDTCLLNETHLESDRTLMFANYVCYLTDRPTRGGGTVILVRWGTDHFAVPVSGLQHLQTTAMDLVLATRPVKLMAAYLSPTRPLIESDLTGGFPVLMAGDHNAKHTTWNSRLITARGSFLRDYSNRNSCLIYGPDSPATVPYTHNETPTSLIQ
jgi:hypothetical protein